MTIDFTAPATLDLALEHGLKADEYARFTEALGRTPNLVELGVVAAMWSEHCSYKSSKVHLAKLPTKAPWVIQGPGENAGVIDIGEGLAAVFKMESHNHPSYIEPYQGAATGVGGILRDVFTMGARPVALLNALRFGDPGHPKTRSLVRGVVHGIGGYGNCVGVPTVGGETNFHPGYNGNILVNAFALGIADQDKIFYSAAKGGPGQPVVYVGAKTGRDGIRGANMASEEFSEGDEEKRPTVQVGDPYKEKLLIEACLELMAGDAVMAIQDMGAAGLTSSSVEMASKGGGGFELWLDKVPMREAGMNPYELMLSESQERMLVVLKPGREAEAQAIFDKWGLDAAVVGVTTDSGRLVLHWHGEIVGDLPLDPLESGAPKYDRPRAELPKPRPLDVSSLPEPADHGEALVALMGCPDLASKRWIWRQYDHEVMNDTVDGPGGDAAVIRVHGTRKALALSADCTPRYVAADPHEGGKQAVAECYRNLSAVGARPLAITNCLNFGNPEKPEIMAQFAGAIEGMAEACRALDFPVVSGNVSLYNETDGKAIPPTPAIAGVGLLEDFSRRAAMGGAKEGDLLVLIGETRGHLGQSLYLREILGREDGPPPPVDLEAERRHGEFVRALIAEGRVNAVHDISDGGLLAALAEMCLASGLGCAAGEGGDLGFWFGEDQGRYLLAVPESSLEAVQAAARNGGVTALPLGGRFEGDRIEIAGQGPGGADGVSLPLARLRAAHEGWMPDYMAHV